MFPKTFIWCRRCGELLRASDPHGSAVDPHSRDFRARHGRHDLHTLHGMGEAHSLEAPPANLARVEYLEVTDGRDWFVLRCAWANAAGPASLNLLPGRRPMIGPASPHMSLF